MTCNVLDHIRSQKTRAFLCSEFAEYDRLLAEEDRHIGKCLQCAAHVQPLYTQLWSNAKTGITIYDPTVETHANDHHRD
jgi:hypothetical protein